MSRRCSGVTPGKIQCVLGQILSAGAEGEARRQRGRAAMRITEIERLLVDIPFHEIPERNMARHLAGWHISEVCRVTTDTSLAGYGETLPNYTWGRVSNAAVERVRGRSPFDCLWDDSLGAGLQMALFDLA